MPSKSRAAAICVDIGEQSVNVIKTNRGLAVLRAGTADYPQRLPEISDPTYRAQLAATIVKAAQRAGVRGGKCVVSVGGPQIITHIFTWPDMPDAALKFNAETEMAQYLPSGVEGFNIDYRILRRALAPKEGGKPGKLVTVMVAAMARDLTAAVMAAAKMARFSPKRIELRANARQKLVDTARLWQAAKPAKAKKEKAKTAKAAPLPVQAGPAQDGGSAVATAVLAPPEVAAPAGPAPFSPAGSFVILSVSEASANMSVFINGLFYAGRYFGSHVMKPVEHAGDADEDEAGYGLIQEVSSIIDYTQYRERGATIGHLLLCGPDRPVRRLQQSLEEYLGIPVLHSGENVNVTFKGSKKRPIRDHLAYLDAFGAALPTPGSAPDLDLRYKKPDKKVFRRIVAPIIVSTAILAMLVSAGIWLPRMRLDALKAESLRLDEEYIRYVAVQRGDSEAIRSEVDFMAALEGQSAAFRSKAPASKVLAAVYGALRSDVSFSSVTISGGNVSLSCEATSLAAAANFLERLRALKMFASVSSGTVGARIEDSGFVVSYDIALTISDDWEAAE
jgi:Tfp pilus assembly PilM family ATPase